MKGFKAPQSLFHQLVLFLGLPLLLTWGVSTFNSYFNAMNAATLAYDRTLLASARTVAERLEVRNGQLQVNVPWVVLDSFERNMNDQLYYKVVNTRGQVISGYADLPDKRYNTPRTELYPALAWFYNTSYQGQLIRAAVLYQPVNEGGVEGMAQIVVAETLQSRHYLASQLLFSTVLTQGALVLLTLFLAYALLKRLLKPMRQLSRLMVRRDPGVLTPLPDILPWSETRLLVVAFNRYIERLRGMIARQERFSADASHQLKTPLTVLKTQVAVALSSDNPTQWRESLVAMNYTLDNTVALTEQLLQLASLKRSEQQGIRPQTPVDIAEIARESSLSRLLQARAKHIDLGYEGEPGRVYISGEALLLAEMCANLLDNALKYSPDHGTVTIRVRCDAGTVVLEVEDSGPGIEPAEAALALMPFHRLDNATGQAGAGLGLALVNDIARYHLSRPEILKGEELGGLLVRVRLSVKLPDVDRLRGNKTANRQ